MPRQLDTKTLDDAARRFAHEWLNTSRRAQRPLLPGKIIVPGVNGIGKAAWITGPELVRQDLFNLTFKDEFGYVVEQIKGRLGARDLTSFESMLRDLAPRDDAVWRDLLAEHWALDPDGKHIEGAIGRIEVGVRPIRRQPFEVEAPWSIRRRKSQGLPLHVPDRTDRATEWREMLLTWPVYAGEAEERAAGREKSAIGAPGPGADPLPDGAFATLPDGSRPIGVGANVTNISAEAAILGIDAIADDLDEGTTAAEIRGRTGSQPADPDAAETGTLLFTLPCSDPAVNAGVDDTDGTVSATFDTITNDSSADATGTLGYCRFAATGTGADDHIDGNATTDGSGATDWNTLSIVSGSTVSMTSASIGMSQGSTAT